MQEFTWQRMVEQLTAFVRQFGHCHVPTGWPDNPRLAKWVSRQRSNEALISAERKEQLTQLGFLWKADMTAITQARWENQYEQLEAFCLQHGHCRVPGGAGEWKSLRSWVDRQRRDWAQLPLGQQQQLLSIGFLPGPSLEAQAEQQWERMFARLERYVQVFGNAQVPKAWIADEELAGWVARQRTYPQRLTLERKRRLTRLGFAFKKDLRQAREAKWQAFYQQLQAFHALHGHCRVPDQYAANPALGKWVSWQRKQPASLSKERWKKLETLGFVFTIERDKELRLQWFRLFGKLKAFYRQYGHCRVPENWPEDKQLAIWVGVQRQEGDQLPDWKRKKLRELNFAWREQLIAERRDKWEMRYEQLRAFHQQHGNCRVTLTNTPDEKFFRWVGKQRRFPQRLTTEQRYRLNEFNFLWTETNRRVKQDKWELSYQQLVDFKRQYGHCQVPEGWNDNPKLARWVAFQRKQEERLPAERKERLDKLGFVWKHQLRQTKQQEWKQLYELLVFFKGRFGHCQVPFNWPENKHLGHWVRRQRMQRETMPTDRMEQLEALNFEWQVSKGPVVPGKS